ncbi:hypothetical protein TNCV_3376461 [Trichonephila clavipes]|nr:hypothetical protein TNCV_3376461 [Trichonephila clavipes]
MSREVDWTLRTFYLAFKLPKPQSLWFLLMEPPEIVFVVDAGSYRAGSHGTDLRRLYDGATPIEIHTNAYGYGIGAAVEQIQNEAENIMDNASRIKAKIPKRIT